jgi:endonuclease G
MPRRSSDDANFQPLISVGVNAFSRLNPTAQLGVVALLLIVGLTLYLTFKRAGSPPDASGSGSASTANLVLGNPSNASTDPANRDNFLMVKPYFALSYNDSKGTPNWVSWTLTDSDLGEAPRKQTFDEDLSLPSGFFRITSRDYSESGFDRGHMCPHGDRTANLEMSYATFVMTNVIPQAPNVNRKAWDQMEEYCRELARHHDRLFILAGPVGEGGVGSRGSRQTIGQGRVVVPTACWKLVVDVPDTGGNDPAQIGPDARVLTVEMPNNEDVVDESWAQYRTTPARIEQETGLHFFTNLKPDLADKFRSRLDRMPLPPPRIVVHHGSGSARKPN